MCQRTLLKKHHFILAKLLRFQRTFHEKSFVSGFGAYATTYLSFGERCAKELRSNIPLILAKAFEVPRNFSRKVSCVRVWGGSPNIQCTQKARHCRAFLFFRNMLELRSKPCFKVLFVKSPLKIRKNFCEGLYNFSLFFPL